jgi:S-DNA-T family DNA segregation ATPase FtsK/SpoIIIE
MGLVGKPQIVKNEIHQLIGQLAFFNSYHDLRFQLIAGLFIVNKSFRIHMRQLKLRQPLHPFPFLIFVLMKDKDKSQVMVAVEERELAVPQFQLPHMYAKGFIYNEQTRDQLLSSIYELLRASS